MRILIIDNDDLDRRKLRAVLADLSRDHEILDLPGLDDDELRRARDLRPEVALIDWSLQGTTGDEIARKLRREVPTVATLAISGEDDDVLVRMVGTGSFDAWTQKKLGIEAWEDQLGQTCQLLAKLADLRRRAADAERRAETDLDASDLPRRLVPELDAIARSHLPVLILGETGTGKEGVAAAIHAASGVDGDLYAVNCAAFTDPTIARGELFGVQTGSYTGADRHQLGLFLGAAGVQPRRQQETQGSFAKWVQEAERNPASLVTELREDGSMFRAYRFGEGLTGTIFLDEVADLPLVAQTLLLRVLDGSGFAPLGHIGPPMAPRVRIIAATSQIDQMIGAHADAVRRDLYHRLAGWVVQLPRLRDRPDDAIVVARRRAAALHVALTPEAERLLRARVVDVGGPFDSGNLRALVAAVNRAHALLPPDARVIDEHILERAVSPRYTGPVYVPLEAGGSFRPATADRLAEDLPALCTAAARDSARARDAVERITQRIRLLHKAELDPWLEGNPQAWGGSGPPLAGPWPTLFAVALLRATKGKWVNFQQHFRTRHEPALKIAALRRRLADDGVSISAAVTNLEALHAALQEGGTAVLDAVRGLLPPRDD